MTLAKLKTVESQIKITEELLRQFEKQAETAESRVTQLQLRLQAAKARHARLKGSISWKITRPLRRLHRLIQKGGVMVAPVAQALARALKPIGGNSGKSHSISTHATLQELTLEEVGGATTPSNETLAVYGDLIAAIKNRHK
jgi:hypothetical protein